MDSLNHLHANIATDPDAFWAATRSFVTRRCQPLPSHLLEDLVQDVMLEIMVSLPRFKTGTDFQGWVASIVHNMRCDVLRILYKSHELPTVDYTPDPKDYLSDKERALQAGHRFSTLRSSLNPANQRILDLLRGGMSLRQVAMTLGTTYAAVQRKVHRWRTNKCLILPK